MSELRFGSTEEALQYLADVTGKQVKVAAGEVWSDKTMRDAMMLLKKGQLAEESVLKEIAKTPSNASAYVGFAESEGLEPPKFLVDVAIAYEKEQNKSDQYGGRG